MEIIPILAFIVLVATISTFVFAFGAYIMFKIRESRGKVAIAQPAKTFQVEYVTPNPLDTELPDNNYYHASSKNGNGNSGKADKKNPGKQPAGQNSG